MNTRLVLWTEGGISRGDFGEFIFSYTDFLGRRMEPGYVFQKELMSTVAGILANPETKLILYTNHPIEFELDMKNYKVISIRML
jgi:hypothetical protein